MGNSTGGTIPGDSNNQHTPGSSGSETNIPDPTGNSAHSGAGGNESNAGNIQENRRPPPGASRTHQSLIDEENSKKAGNNQENAQPPPGNSVSNNQNPLTSSSNIANGISQSEDNDNEDVSRSSGSGTNNADQSSPSVPVVILLPPASRELDAEKKSVGPETPQTPCNTEKDYSGTSDPQESVNSSAPKPGSKVSGGSHHTSVEDEESAEEESTISDNMSQDDALVNNEGSHIHAGASSQGKPIPSGVSVGFEPQSNEQNQSEFNQIDYVAIISASITIIIVFSILSILWVYTYFTTHAFMYYLLLIK